MSMPVLLAASMVLGLVFLAEVLNLLPWRRR